MPLNTADNEIARMTTTIEYRYWSDLTKFGEKEPTKITGDPDFAEATAARARRNLRSNNPSTNVI